MNFSIPRHTSVLGTLPLTEASVATYSPSEVQLPSTGTRVHGNRFLNHPSELLPPSSVHFAMYLDDEAIADQLADGLTGVGVRDLINFVRVQPNLALAAADHGGREALLSTEIDPAGNEFCQLSWK